MQAWGKIIFCTLLLLFSINAAEKDASSLSPKPEKAAAEPAEKKVESPLNTLERKLLACTLLQIMQAERDSDEIKKFKGKSRNETRAMRRKIKVTMIKKCVKEITSAATDAVYSVYATYRLLKAMDLKQLIHL